MALNKDFDPVSDMPGLKKMSPFIVVAVVLFLLWAFSPFVIVGAGERGVVFNQFHGVEQKILQEGLSFIVPVVERRGSKSGAARGKKLKAQSNKLKVS